MSTKADLVERIEAERTARAVDPMRPANALLREAAAEITKLRTERDALADPVVVHLNMLRGGIAKLSWKNIQHLYPEEVAAVARDMRERCGVEAFRAITAVCITDDGNTILADHVASAIRALPDTPAVIATEGGS